MSAPRKRSITGVLRSFVGAGLVAFAAHIGGAYSADIAAECGREFGDPITIQLRGEIVKGDASTLRTQLSRCSSAYDADAVRSQADAAQGRDARKTRSALDARADAIDAQDLIFSRPAVRLYLDSPGGNPAEAMEIGRLARQEKLQTVVDVNRTCSDACLLAFIGGAVRKTSWSADIGISQAMGNTRQSAPDIGPYATAMGLPTRTIDKLLEGTPHRFSKAAAFDLGLSGADPTYVDLIKAAFIETWGQDAREVIEASAAFEVMARSCAERQSAPSPINQLFAACITQAGEQQQLWQRYLKAIQMIDALQHSTGSRGLPDHRFFVSIAGDWSF